MKFYFWLLPLCMLIIACIKPQPPVNILPSNPELTYMGRTGFYNDTCVGLYWSGASVKINFEGTSLTTKLKNLERDNYYNVVLDGDSITILHIGTELKEYTLADSLSKGKHTVELFRRTEWSFGETKFYGFKIGSGGKLLPKDAPKTRSIEFYGNSITAGYGSDDLTEQDRWDSIFTNNYNSYAALTARHFNADYSCIAHSGIGIMISWKDLIMPELYDRHNPNDSISRWDYHAKPVDLVVVNLFQNDSWLVEKPSHKQFKLRFGDTAPDKKKIVHEYVSFVRRLREHYPEANILCMLGNMNITEKGSPWPGYVKEAVGILNDPKIYTHFIAYKNTKGHPEIPEQKAMAKSVISFIEKQLGW